MLALKKIFKRLGRTTQVVVLVSCVVWLVACSNTRPIIKIGLVAPFEGRYREVGYEVIYAVRLAVREANNAGGVAGHSIELVALDDTGNSEMAVAQARKLALDPQIVGVVGHWLDETTLAAAPEYVAASLPLLATTTASELEPSAFRLWPNETTLQTAFAAPDTLTCFYPCGSFQKLDWIYKARQSTPTTRLIGPPLWAQTQFAHLMGEASEEVTVLAPAPLPADSADPTFAERYRAISNGVEPRAYAVLAYDATHLLFAALERATQTNGTPTRAGVTAALRRMDYTGLSGAFHFDDRHQWIEARGWEYVWRNGELKLP